VLLAAGGGLLFTEEKLMVYRQHEANLVGMVNRGPRKVERHARKLHGLRGRYRGKREATAERLAQLDDLQQRLGREQCPASHPLQAAIAQRRRALEWRRRILEAILVLLEPVPQDRGVPSMSDDAPMRRYWRRWP
jgi:hypothetical protein